MGQRSIRLFCPMDQLPAKPMRSELIAVLGTHGIACLPFVSTDASVTCHSFLVDHLEDTSIIVIHDAITDALEKRLVSSIGELVTFICSPSIMVHRRFESSLAL
jgi:hypothetical protein